jgi:hypothetical protein
MIHQLILRRKIAKLWIVHAKNYHDTMVMLLLYDGRVDPASLDNYRLDLLNQGSENSMKGPISLHTMLAVYMN